MKIPHGWKAGQLRKLAEIRSGLSKSSNRGGHCTELPYLRVANVQDGYLSLDDIQTIPVPSGSIDRYLLKRGDLLMVEGNGNPANLGRGCIWNASIDPCVHQNHIFCVRPNQAIINEDYLSKWIQSSAIRAHLLEGAKGSTGLASLNATQIGDIPIHYPPLPEQEVIAEALSIWDAAIEKSERLITAKERLFRRDRIDAIHHPAGGSASYSPLGAIFHPLTRKNTVGETSVLTTSAQRGLVSQRKYFSKSVASENLESYFLIENGEFAYNRSSSNGYPYGAIKRLDDSERGVLSTLNICMALIDPTAQNSDYFVHTLESGVLNRGLAQICQEGARSHGLLNISREDFFSLEIPSPVKAIQDAIATRLNLALQELELMKRRLELLKRQKSGLMQKLLTGTWRVKVA